MAIADLTAQRLREILHYDPETGLFRWSATYNLGRLRDKRVGHVSQETGHINIRVQGRAYEAHRLAWLYMTGSWPTETVDHKNRIPEDNRWRNLRLATMGQQRQNQKMRKDCKHGYRGLQFHKHGLWRVRITVDGKKIHIGYFKKPEDGVAARLAAERKYFTHSPACEPQAACPDQAVPREFEAEESAP